MKKVARTAAPRPRLPLQFPRNRPGGGVSDRGSAGHSVHVIEPDEEELAFLCDFLSIPGLRVSGSTDPARALGFVARMHPEILICNLAALEMGADALLDRTRVASPTTRVILVSNWPR